MNETISTPSLFFKRFHGQKRQTIVDLISDSTTGLTRSEVAAAIDSPTNKPDQQGTGQPGLENQLH